jgi:hypothetical protein
VRQSIEKYYVEPREVFTEPLSLGAVCVLREARPPHKPGIERPNMVDATLHCPVMPIGRSWCGA